MADARSSRVPTSSSAFCRYCNFVCAILLSNCAVKAMMMSGFELCAKRFVSNRSPQKLSNLSTNYPTSSPAQTEMSMSRRMLRSEKLLQPNSSYSIILWTTFSSLKMAFLKAPISSDS